jgi:hypothetical protein
MAFVHNRSRGGRGGVWGDTSGTLPRYKTTQQPTAAAAAGTVAVGDFIWDPGLTHNNNIHDDPSLGDLDVIHKTPVYPRSGASTTPATRSQQHQQQQPALSSSLFLSLSGI